MIYNLIIFGLHRCFGIIIKNLLVMYDVSVTMVNWVPFTFFYSKLIAGLYKTITFDARYDIDLITNNVY